MALETSQESVQNLLDGFDALLQDYNRVWRKSQQLEQTIRSAKTEVSNSLFSSFVTMMKHLALDL